jgi:hypothetical protein
LQQNCIGGNTISFPKDHNVAACHFPPENAPVNAVANHQRPWTCQIAESLQAAFRAALLNHSDQNRHACKDKENERFLRIAEQEVTNSACNQQSQHRLAKYLEQYS